MTPETIRKLMIHAYAEYGLVGMFRELPLQLAETVYQQQEQTAEQVRAELEGAYIERLMLESPYPQRDVQYVN